MRKTTIAMKIKPHHCLRNENMTLTFYRQSHTFIDCGKILIDYQIVDVFSNVVTQKCIILNDQEQDVTIASPHCGHYHIQVRLIQCFDLLQCFSISKKVSLRQSFDVMPHYYPIDAIAQEVYTYDSQDNSSLIHQKGDDYSEIFEIRSYREGDELKHIHWNMSSKFQELFVKVGSEPLQEKWLFVMEYKENNEFYDEQFDYFYSLCVSLLKVNKTFEIVTSSHDPLQTQSVDSLDKLHVLIKWMMKNPIKSLDFSLLPHSYCFIHGQNLEVHHQ